MAKQKKKTANPEKLFGIIFGIVGAVLLVIALVVAAVYRRIMQESDRAQGVVTDSGNSTEVSYTYEGTEYVTRVSLSSTSLKEGKHITVYVDKDNPENIKLAGYMFLPSFIMGIIGICFQIPAGIFFAIYGRGNKKRKRLMAEGRKLYAEVTGGRLNWAYEINGRHPFKLECRYTDPGTGETYLYSSNNTWTDPNLYIGGNVAVYVDTADFSKYYVDLESLTEKDGEEGSFVHDFR